MTPSTNPVHVDLAPTCELIENVKTKFKDGTKASNVLGDQETMEIASWLKITHCKDETRVLEITSNLRFCADSVYY